ncbi:GH3 auxin-responsive promoter family protein [Mesohalobacter halotolerans]|uniref:GH3 auxin-responsive promoter family protein n=1 Tax=Mesohalobacter halotolerans TaxID=1883405 RepID=A0A4U5TQK9_9FLAO|nr:GH3 auxin-responsive promoter family protein [Mesohalobacter halotolerans]TKS56333.1 GH3 auxin-responsive promoter family protein [Mesohalobacter halotolerans]
MPIQIIHNVASWFLKKRIHQMELFLKYPHEVQNELLFKLLSKAKDTEYGKEHDFKSIKTYRDFNERLPIVSYEDIYDKIEQSRQGVSNIFWPSPIKMFAKSSGTTNAKSKFIPLSEEALEDNHYAASKDLLCMYLNNNENSKLFTGKGLRLGGSKEIYQNNGTSFGDLSALLIDNMPLWASFSSTPSNAVSLMGDWEQKMPAIIDETIKQNVTSLAGVPSWMLVLLHEILDKTGKKHIKEIWPDLEVYFHGGVSFEPYMNQYQNIIPDKNFNYYEIYNASEGFFAAQDQNNSKDLMLMLNYGIFYEFIPMDIYGHEQEKAIALEDVQVGKNYAMVITTNSGLWRYKIGDTVRFTSKKPYRIKVTGRTKHHINVFGEELIIENAEAALKKAALKHDVEIIDYTVGPIFMEGKDKGAHEWIIEFKKAPESLVQFKQSLDDNLRAVNSDYDAKRDRDTTLKMLKLNKAKAGLFYSWLKNNEKLGGQHKIPRLSNERKYIEELLTLQQKMG